MIQVERLVAGSEPKQFLRVDGDADDVLLSSMITQVRDLVEENLQRSIISQTITLTTDNPYEVSLPFGPGITVHSVRNDDGDDLDYTIIGDTVRITSPTVSVTGGGGITGFTVEYEAGGDCPEGLKLGLLEVLMWLYENRSDISKLDYMIYKNQNLSPYRMKIWI